jgi:hypothetical protein
MAGTIIADKIQTENSFLTLNVGATQIATMNSSGIYSSSGAKMLGTDGSIGNSSISGAIVSGNLSFDSIGTSGIRLPAANTLAFHTSGTEDMRIDSSGNIGIGTASPNAYGAGFVNLQANGSDAGGGGIVQASYGTTTAIAEIIMVSSEGRFGTRTNHPMILKTNNTERMRIDSAGEVLIGKTSTSSSVAGIRLNPLGTAVISRNDELLFCNRLTTDGALVQFQQDGTSEGSISVSGTTVSYNGGHLSRYAQIANGNTNIILKGTVLSNLDEMNVYIDADGNPVTNEQLNKVKVSDTEGDADVAGVFVNWAYDEQHDIEEINMAMTGDMIIRIAEGVTVARGDLLMSAGDGTAKPQSDDIVRSKTIAKVTSNHVTCTYEDGSYCVPCVLMAC